LRKKIPKGFDRPKAATCERLHFIGKMKGEKPDQAPAVNRLGPLASRWPTLQGSAEHGLGDAGR